MNEELITQLDELSVSYEEDPDTGVLTINIADVDKSTLIEVINILNNMGETFDIDDTSITLSGVATTEDTGTESESETDYMSEALGQYGGDTGLGM